MASCQSPYATNVRHPVKLIAAPPTVCYAGAENGRARYTKVGETLRQFSWNDAVTETGLSRYKLGKAAAHCGIVIAKSQRDRRNVALTLEELSRIREAARDLWPDAKAAKTASLTDAGNFAAILASRLSELERRVRALEARQHVPTPLPTVQQVREPREPVHMPLPAPAPLDIQPRHITVSTFRTETQNSIAKWLSHHGVGYSTAREWHALPLDRAEAIRYAVAHKASVGYRAMHQRIHTCQDAACVCHDVLAARENETPRPSSGDNG